MSKPLDLIDIVVDSQLTRAGLWKIGNRLSPFRGIFAQIKGLTATIQCKCRVRLIADTGFNAEFVDTFGDAVERRVGSQFAAGGIEEVQACKIYTGVSLRVLRSVDERERTQTIS